MRPLKITMSAFGPYAGEMNISMSALGEQGLYLITGDTGAGKTTIFDAICYALYGEASGANRTGVMLRSKYADADTPTYVEMTFQHRGETYKIRRNPEYERPAKRGSGMKMEKAAAEFELADGTVITKVKDVTAAVEALIGINRDQFSQIVMLAQGDFMKLLLADTKQRQDIFRELFHTGYYQSLQYRLEEERKKLYGSCEDAKKSVAQYVSGIMSGDDETIAEQVSLAKEGELTTEAVVLLLDQLLESDRDRLHMIEKENAKTEQELEETNRALGRAQELEQTRKTLEQARVQFAENEQQLIGTKAAYEEAKAALPAREQLQQTCSLIEATLPEYDRHEELLKKIAADIEKQEHSQEELARRQQEEENAKEILEAQKKELAELSDAGIEREKLIAERDRLEALQASYEELDERIEQLTQEQQHLENMQQTYLQEDALYKQKKEIYEHMDQSYRDAQAGILASRLEMGMPCPVCGSTMHPKLAELPAEVPGDQELEQAKQEAEDAREAAQRSSARAGEQKTTVETMYAELINQAKKALLEMGGEVSADVSSLVDQLSEQQKSEGQISQELVSQGLIQIMEKLAHVRDKLTGRYQTLLGQIQAEEEKLSRRQQLETQIPDKEKQSELLKKEIAGIRETLAALEVSLKADNTQVELLKTKLEYVDKQAAMTQIRELSKQIDQLQAAYEHAEQTYQEHTNQAAVLKGQIEGYEKTLQNAEALDYEALCEQKTILQQKKTQDSRQIQTIAARIESNVRVKENILEKSKELEGKEKRLQWVSALANTANGKLVGKERVMLETYIQRTYFDRVLRRANVRLMKMSSGQYELKRLAEAMNNKSQSGLELEVIDHYNGSTRSVKTLSGGESFMAALSLALGLSEEIQTSAGGIQIDTMFVDEGFGSLDSDSLELAYHALASLTDGSRLVGIISHVSELKEKIDKQIIVTKEKSGGSSAQIVV